MKERPIIFNSAMVRAILDDRKTQTRRVIKPQEDEHGRIRFSNKGPFYDPAKEGILHRCPYGKVGDTLWVRESWGVWCNMQTKANNEEYGVMYRADRQYSASIYPQAAKYFRNDNVDGTMKWRPSIHMPRWAARIFLETTGIRAERLQEITEADAIAEGIEERGARHYRNYNYPDKKQNYYAGVLSAKTSFETLWDSINAKPKPANRNPHTNALELCKVAYPWDDIREETVITKKASKFYNCKVYIVGNPYVWAEEFVRKEQYERQR